MASCVRARARRVRIGVLTRSRNFLGTGARVAALVLNWERAIGWLLILRPRLLRQGLTLEGLSWWCPSVLMPRARPCACAPRAYWCC
jgi:hypothetical protein